MTRPASTLLAAGLRPTDPAPAERAEPAKCRWSVALGRDVDGRVMWSARVEGQHVGAASSRAEAERIARHHANDPAPSTFGTAPDASIPSAVERYAEAAVQLRAIDRPMTTARAAAIAECERRAVESEWPACLGCGCDVVPDGEADEPVCPDCIDTYDGSPVTPEERERIARILLADSPAPRMDVAR